ncbi:hypothetical protein K439DRAFT_50531 [Ramaria rubella]|nr:hypothetical protein K439DRAFT_50531 [Ramaria rubella]
MKRATGSSRHLQLSRWTESLACASFELRTSESIYPFLLCLLAFKFLHPTAPALTAYQHLTNAIFLGHILS